MKKILSITVLFLFLTTEASAFCVWGVVPSGRIYEPLDATEAFIAYDDGVQTLVLRPEWKGNASDLAIVYPTPSKPEITEGPADLFEELEEATNPEVIFMMMDEGTAGLSAVEDDLEVEVIEQKHVGDYVATVLTATDATDLTTWLEDNGYNFTNSDSEKVEHYVQQGGYYFIALKVDLSEVELDEDNTLLSALDPIQFTFETDKPELPMRTLKSPMPEMTFDLYTLGDQAIYVPGVDTVWSNVVDADFLSQAPSLSNFDPKGKWLVRQEVRFSPQNSDEDLYLNVAASNAFEVTDPNNQLRIDPEELNTKTGILPGKRGRVVYFNTAKSTYNFTRSLTIGSVGIDVQSLQKYLNDAGFAVATIGAGSPGNETTYFGERTRQAVIKFQNFHRTEILTPVGLSVGTGYFGPSTIKFLNQ